MTVDFRKTVASGKYEVTVHKEVVDRNRQTTRDVFVTRVGSEEVVASMELGVKTVGLVVSRVDVLPGVRRERLGTALYETAAALACTEGRPLVSDEHRSHFAEAFWLKQKSKYRATCVKGKGQVFNSPLRAATRSLRTADKNALENSLPHPRTSASTGAEYWPCLRYEVDLLCMHIDLKGLSETSPHDTMSDTAVLAAMGATLLGAWLLLTRG